ncbi:hypothetical protein FOZ62_030728, partial [Perkinsus olseni]
YVDDKLGSLTSTVASNHDEFCDRIQDLGERLGDISIAGKENLEELERRLREEVEAASSAVMKSGGQTRELLASEVSRLEGMVAGLAARLDTGGEVDNKRFTDWQRQWEGRVSEVSDACRRLRDSIIEQRAALDAKIREETRKVEAQCKRAVDRAAEENRQHVANEGAQREENLHRRIAGLVEEEEEKRRAMNGHLEAMEGRLDDKLAQASQGLARHLNDIRLAVNKMAKASQECVDQQVSQLLKASEGRIIASCEHLMEVEKMRVDELVEGQSEKSETRWAKKEEERWKMMCKVVQDVDDKLTLTRVNLQEDIQLASESLGGEIEAIDKALRSVEDLVKGGNRTLQESIDRAVKALHSADAHQKRRLEATKEAIVERTRVMDEATRMLIDEVSMRLESQKDEADGKIHLLDERIQTQVITAATKISSGISSIQRCLQSLGQAVSSSTHDISSRMARLSAESAAKAERNETDIERSRREISDKCAAIDAQLRHLISSLGTRTHEQMESLHKNLSHSLEESTGTIQRDITAITAAMEKMGEEVDDRELQLAREIERQTTFMKASMRSIGDELRGEVARLDEDITSSTKNLGEKLQAVTEDLQRTAKSTEQQLLSQKVDTIKDDMDAYIKRLQ